MEVFDSTKLPEDVISLILDFKNRKLQELRNNGIYLNEIIREDILPLLDKFCTVVYYPITDCENNGFHKTYLFNGEHVQFVYINTNQAREKQIFTAAHELGHVWGLDDLSKDLLKNDYSFTYGERIMNRFAAELLMPADLFNSYTKELIASELQKSGKITLGGMIRIITSTMNEFFVPYKSVLCRLYELEFILEETVKILWGNYPNLPRHVIEDYSKKYAAEQGYYRLYKSDRIKMIDGLKDLLDKAKMSGAFPDQWLQEFYQRFELEHNNPNEILQEQIDVKKGVEKDARDANSCNR